MKVALAAAFGLTLASPTTATQAAAPQPPSILLGDFYAQVEAHQLFRDSKTFADATPRRPVAQILADWRRDPARDDASLRMFVAANFDVPSEGVPMPSISAARPPIVQHIDALWPVLTRQTVAVPEGSSALPLPRPYVVPGGRFRELYYWDSYFTMLGLASSGRGDLVEAMIDDFGSLIQRFGHIPNGTRTYYLSRSQPPYFALMVGLSNDRSRATLKRRTDWMRAEHAFWMAGEATVAPGHASRRVVRLADGTILNRYWDDRAAPRDESWREDVALAATTPSRRPADLFRNVRAAAESGWDFSSRWLGDGRSLSTIRTTRMVPIDLNSLMALMEERIAANCRLLGDARCAANYRVRTQARRRAIMTHMWNPAGGFFADYDLDRKALSDQLTAAAAYPLFAGIARADQAKQTATALAHLVGPGGIATTLKRTGQQWDAPNGWAPLQWIAITGLGRYGQCALAARIRSGWLDTVTREYRASGRMLEKYDVLERRPGGGGEYALQDGFGWTNGVTRALLAQPDVCRPGGTRIQQKEK